MSNKDLPAWAFDLVAAVERFEDEHRKGDSSCMNAELRAVPDEVRFAAAAMKRLNRKDAK